MNRNFLLAFTLILVAISAACSIPFTIQTSDNLVSTLAAQTVQAWENQNQPTQSPLPSQTPYPTATSYPTLTPYPTYTLPPTQTTAATATPKVPATVTPQPCNQALFVSETIPDGSKFSPGSLFTKSWRLKNVGTCTWNPGYKLVFFEGNQMGGPDSVKLDNYVAPGEKTDALVNLKAPSKPGTYTGYWKLQSDEGDKFAQIYVQIKVPSTNPTITPTPSQTPTATATPKTYTPQPCNQASFVSETIPDGTIFSPNAEFTKSWRLLNTGTCTWNPTYKLVFFDGDQMSGPSYVKLNDYISPGEKTDILVDLKAPANPGTYTGYWKLQSDDGYKFAGVYVQIKVPSTLFAVTSVALTASPASFSGACPKTFSINADITANAAGNVTYKWRTSDGLTSTLKSVKFDSKGTKTVQMNLQISASGTHWAKIYIDSPNHQWFGPVNIDVTCQ